MSQTIASYIITPDGTKLQSFHRHDYKTHTDKNGEEYMIDGGLDYCRRSVNKQDARCFSITMADPHTVRREHFHWGTHGKDGKQPLHWVALADMETAHIEMILENMHVEKWLDELFKDELEYRNAV